MTNIGEHNTKSRRCKKRSERLGVQKVIQKDELQVGLITHCSPNWQQLYFSVIAPLLNGLMLSINWKTMTWNLSMCCQFKDCKADLRFFKFLASTAVKSWNKKNGSMCVKKVLPFLLMQVTYFYGLWIKCYWGKPQNVEWLSQKS